MGDPQSVTVYRVCNKSDGPLAFDTVQGFKISLNPGSVIDLFSYEIEGSETFQEIDDPERILKLSAQEFSVDDDFLNELKEDLASFRGGEPSPEAPIAEELEPPEFEPPMLEPPEAETEIELDLEAEEPEDLEAKEPDKEEPSAKPPAKKQPAKARKRRAALKPPARLG